MTRRGRRLPSRLGAALRSCCLDPIHATSAPPGRPTIPASGDLAGLAWAAQFHGVPGYVHRRLHADERVPEEERARLEHAYERAVMHHLAVVSDVRRVAEAFASVDVPWLVVKGPVVAEALHESAGLRSYDDLDLVVPAHHLRRATEALEASGATLVDRNWDLLTADLRGEVHLRLSSGISTDLHWHLVNAARVRAAFSIPMTALFERAGRLEIDGIEVPVLADDDMLVHLALHTTLSGGYRLVWLKDIERFCRHRTPDWDAVVTNARRWNAPVATGVALMLAHRSLGAEVPAAVLEALVPSPTWRGFTRQVAALSPPERAATNGSLLRLLCRSTRADVATSRRTFARHAAQWTRTAALGGGWGGPRRFDDERVPGSQRHPSEGPEGRERYLDAVAASSE